MRKIIQIFCFALFALAAVPGISQTTATFSIVEQDSLETAAPGSVRSPWRYSNDSTDLFRYVGSSWVPLFDTLYSRNDSLFYVKFGTEKFAAEVSASGGVSDGDKGDITVASSGTSWTIDNSTIGSGNIINGAVGWADLSSSVQDSIAAGGGVSSATLADSTAAVRADFPDISGLATQSALVDTAAAIRGDFPSEFSDYGTDNQIPYTNSGGNGFDYSTFLTYDGTTRMVVGQLAFFLDGRVQGAGSTSPLRLRAANSVEPLMLEAANNDVIVELDDANNTVFTVEADNGDKMLEIDHNSSTVYLGYAGDRTFNIQNYPGTGNSYGADFVYNGGIATGTRDGGDLYFRGGTAGDAANDGGSVIIQPAENTGYVNGLFVQGGNINPGYVGINTTTPSYRLDIDGPVRIQDASAPTGASGVMYNNSGNPKWHDGTAYRDITLDSDAATGDLDGTIGSPLVVGLNGEPLSASSPDDKDQIEYNGSAWVYVAKAYYSGYNAGGTVTTTTANTFYPTSAWSNSVNEGFTNSSGSLTPPETAVYEISYSASVSHDQGSTTRVDIAVGSGAGSLISGTRNSIDVPSGERMNVSGTIIATLSSAADYELYITSDANGAVVTLQRVSISINKIDE